MASELSQAVSFANGYFALADNLVPDLEDHLAEDVVLDWFGQTIEGRDNVTTFMKHQKITSRHIFEEINPVTIIGYQKQRPLRRKYFSGTCEDDDDDNSENKYKRQCFSDGLVVENENSFTDESSDNIHDMEVEYDDNSEFKKIFKPHDELENEKTPDTTMECNLNFAKLKLNGDYNSTPKRPSMEQEDYLNSDVVNSALNELGDKIKMDSGMKATNAYEIEKKIMQLKNKNEFKLPLGFIKNELGQGDGPPCDNTSIKYIEACGAIEFSRFFNTKQIRKDIRKRLCRLQIAYSIKDQNINSTVKELKRESLQINSDKINDKTEVALKDLNKLKSLKELRELSNKFIPPGDDQFDLSTDDDDDDYHKRNQFLKTLKLKSIHNTNDDIDDLVTPKYSKNQLTSDKSPKRLLAGTGDTRGFVFNYNIHLIIYESNTKCRLNLSHEFESKELSDN